MNTAWNEFKYSIAEVKKIRTIYDHMIANVRLSQEDVSDLLRAQLVNAVSALDRFLHELVRIGIVESFLQQRPLTNKFKSFVLTSQTIIKILELERASTPPQSVEEDKTYWINKEVTENLKTLSFQHPNKIKDALSYIWKEEHKWQVIAKEMNLPGYTDNDKQRYLEQTLVLIAERRNQMVHEADVDPSTHIRRSVSVAEIDVIISFIELFAETIFKQIKNAHQRNQVLLRAGERRQTAILRRHHTGQRVQDVTRSAEPGRGQTYPLLSDEPKTSLHDFPDLFRRSEKERTAEPHPTGHCQ